MTMSVSHTEQTLRRVAAERVLVLDGAMGTMIQALGLDEEGYRGARFDAWNREVRGNNDLLILSQPVKIRDIHLAYFRAGADIVSTNTFSSTRIAQADYGMAGIAYELNVEGARLARAAADLAQNEDGRPRFVAGAIGPTNRTASISPDVANPGFRAVTFDELREAYAEQVKGLIEGGADLLLIETIFDTLNAKAAIAAVADVTELRGEHVPVMISGTITDRSGRLLSGQTQAPGHLRNAPRRLALDRAHDLMDMLGRGAAAAADDVDQSSVGELAEQLCHEAWALVVTAELVGQTRIGIGAHEGVGDARDLGDVGAHLARAEGAIESDRERRGVTHRVPERRRRLPGEKPPGAVGNGS